MARQAECPKCRARYVLEREVDLSLAFCGGCGERLQSTMNLFDLPVKKRPFIAACLESWALPQASKEEVNKVQT